MPSVRLQSALVFVAAVLAKAWEPLAIGWGQGGRAHFQFAAVLVVCELLKLLASLALLLTTCRGRRDAAALSPSWIFERSVAYSFGMPALFLAICNHMLGFAVPLLNPILYQVTRASARQHRLHASTAAAAL